ncbi:MAG: hypothetical protein LH472_12290 [Pyrinomonadaceae bacterium]|nr:hypothetical protein [Pyrinomonadaceae bacterium]
MKHSFLAALASLALLITSNHLCFAQTNPANSSPKKQVQAAKLEKLKKQVEKIGIGGKITVIRLDERDFYGSVSSIEADGFQIVEVDLKQTVGFKYAELKKINKGDGEKNLFSGRRVNPQKGWLYGVAIFGTLFVILAIGLSDKDF